MPWFQIPEKDTDLFFHLRASHPKSMQNWKRYDRMKLKNVFAHNFISFQANALIPDSRERYTSSLSFSSVKSKIECKQEKILGIEVCERGWYWWSWVCKVLWCRAEWMWMMMKVIGDLKGFDECCGVEFCFVLLPWPLVADKVLLNDQCDKQFTICVWSFLFCFSPWPPRDRFWCAANF